MPVSVPCTPSWIFVLALRGEISSIEFSRIYHHSVTVSSSCPTLHYPTTTQHGFRPIVLFYHQPSPSWHALLLVVAGLSSPFIYSLSCFVACVHCILTKKKDTSVMVLPLIMTELLLVDDDDATRNIAQIKQKQKSLGSSILNFSFQLKTEKFC